MRLYPLALVLVLTGCGGRVVVDSYDLNAEPCSEIEVRAGRLWRTLALALVASRGRGNAPDVLAAVDALEKLGVKVP